MAIHAAHDQQQSPLFRLPPELRNRVYEMAFEDEAESIDVTQVCARKPSSALIRSCRRMHAESNGIFKAAFQDFWQKDFVIDLCKGSAAIVPLYKHDILHPSRVDIFIIRPNWGDATADLRFYRTDSSDKYSWRYDAALALSFWAWSRMNHFVQRMRDARFEDCPDHAFFPTLIDVAEFWMLYGPAMMT